MPAIPRKERSPSLANSHNQSNNGSGLNSEQQAILPTLLEIRNLASAGAKRFLNAVDASTILTEATHTVLKLLNPSRKSHPEVRSITLILRDFEGVAYTTGKDIDFEHKEIHFSTKYIESISADRIKEEITGVLVHETVHVWQWNGENSCNGGLIEGIADWVRLKAGLAPPHWRQRCEGCAWDNGYETTAYFLNWIEERAGEGTVVKINQMLKQKYVEEDFWKNVHNGRDVRDFWAEYAQSLSDNEKDEEDNKGNGHSQAGTASSEHEHDKGDDHSQAGTASSEHVQDNRSDNRSQAGTASSEHEQDDKGDDHSEAGTASSEHEQDNRSDNHSQAGTASSEHEQDNRSDNHSQAGTASSEHEQDDRSDNHSQAGTASSEDNQSADGEDDKSDNHSQAASAPSGDEHDVDEEHDDHSQAASAPSEDSHDVDEEDDGGDDHSQAASAPSEDEHDVDE